MFWTVSQYQETLGGLFMLKNEEMKKVGGELCRGKALPYGEPVGLIIMPESPKCQNFYNFTLGFQYAHKIPLFSSESSFHSSDKRVFHLFV